MNVLKCKVVAHKLYNLLLFLDHLFILLIHPLNHGKTLSEYLLLGTQNRDDRPSPRPSLAVEHDIQ